MVVSLHSIPCELIALVTEWLDLEDICSLGFTSRYFFGTLMFNESIAKRALEYHAPDALETREAQANKPGSYARNFRRCLKRNLAITNAEPFQVATIAMADNHVYSSGMLCYSTSRQHIRLRDLHRSSTHEIEIDSRMLLDQALAESVGKYVFYPIHYAEGVLSCTYQHSIQSVLSTFLLFVDPHLQEVLGSRRIHVEGGKPVIRNTKECVFFIEREASRQTAPSFEWVIQTLDLQKKSWSQESIRLPSITGSVIDKTVCFDIIGDYFYAVCSDQGRYAPDTIDWTSSYRVVRCLLSDMTQKEEVEIWRRKHEEGPINDAWTSIKLEQDPRTGELSILEVRMEWLRGESPSVRTCYKTRVDFSDIHDILSIPASPGPSPLSSGDIQLPQGIGILPAPQMQRSPESMHHDGAEATRPVSSSSFVRSYQRMGNVFVDMRSVEEPDGSMKMYLQCISRRSPDKPNITKLWPPKTSTGGQYASAINEILSPSNFYKTPHAIMDDRIIISALKGERKKRHGEPFAIILISFDPASRFAGRNWPNREPLACPDSLAKPVIMPNKALGKEGEQLASWASVVPAITHELNGNPSGFNFALSSVPNVE
ncbi:hypothetical protein F5X68DRAFT_265725 [Plectosphaerella plurivora]|uniref:F-box domain-containing protein n=1 Tax=Plectosphaerella plurivora TaxID=936078 RepID=A0A9P9A5S7_9PEZI|nr:hypothetical protein F5X68DRAFT_265725 [Plectosphaerella plurivora]